MNGAVDGADFLFWQRNLGDSALIASAVLAYPVPEPAAAGPLLALASLLDAKWREFTHRRPS
jgi:hypothetical protein